VRLDDMPLPLRKIWQELDKTRTYKRHELSEELRNAIDEFAKVDDECAASQVGACGSCVLHGGPGRQMIFGDGGSDCPPPDCWEC
jgi:hypothetical protein